jgi:hypothetical protein
MARVSLIPEMNFCLIIITVFGNVTSCNLIEYCYLFKISYFIFRKLAGSSENSVNFYEMTGCHMH